MKDDVHLDKICIFDRPVRNKKYKTIHIGSQYIWASLKHPGLYINTFFHNSFQHIPDKYDTKEKEKKKKKICEQNDDFPDCDFVNVHVQSRLCRSDTHTHSRKFIFGYIEYSHTDHIYKLKTGKRPDKCFISCLCIHCTCRFISHIFNYHHYAKEGYT